MANQLIIENEPVFIIHQRPYSETSQILNLFSKNYGRVDVIAKGSKRPKSKFRSFMQPFMPLNASWSGRSQLKTLRNIEASQQHQSLIEADHFLSALYMNELILNFLSNAAIGSSSSSSFGFFTRIRASATRCCWPPES